MRFDEQARENVQAAERLLPDDEGEREALPNASASRSYYGVYLAVADRAQQAQRPMTSSDRGWYRHDELPEDALAWGLLDLDARDDLTWLYGLRIKADYLEDQVSHEEASLALEVAQRMVDSMLGRGSP